MRQSAATALRRALAESAGEEVSGAMQEFIYALLQPPVNDHLTLDARYVAARQESRVEFQEYFDTLEGAAERVADLRSLPDIAEGTLRLTRDDIPIFECALPNIAGGDTSCDVRFSAMLGLIEQQSAWAAPIDFVDARVPVEWISRQSPAVRQAVRALCVFSVEPEFFSQLAVRVPLIREVELVPLLHDAWSGPSQRVFEFAVSRPWTVARLTEFINDAELGLHSPEAVEDFEAIFSLDVDLEMVCNWLRERAYVARLGH